MTISDCKRMIIQFIDIFLSLLHFSNVSLLLETFLVQNGNTTIQCKSSAEEVSNSITENYRKVTIQI